MALGASHTRSEYDALAPAYDALTADYCYDRWLLELERLARRHGLRGRRLLDIACGTGNSFLPLLRLGYEITGCDISGEMLARAAAKAPGATLLRADMRRLRGLGTFDLVTCLDDSLNYLLGYAELVDALTGIGSCLAPRGVAVWDLNTLAMYRTAFATDWVDERDGFFIAWQGQTPTDFEAGGIARAAVDVFHKSDPAGWRRTTSQHEQRHWSVDAIEAAAGAAGLRILSRLGQRRGARIEPGLDERIHTKAVFIAARIAAS